jgi:hypothetical protein
MQANEVMDVQGWMDRGDYCTRVYLSFIQHHKSPQIARNRELALKTGIGFKDPELIYSRRSLYMDEQQL